MVLVPFNHKQQQQVEGADQPLVLRTAWLNKQQRVEAAWLNKQQVAVEGADQPLVLRAVPWALWPVLCPVWVKLCLSSS